jgi:L-glyceraldehyde 3-phosphate reductase
MEILPVCEREGLGQVVFSPLEQGLLTGKYSGGQIPNGSRLADEKRNVFMRDKVTPDALRRVDRLVGIARGIGASAAQVALAWCLRRWSVASVIVGATRPEQVVENAKAAELKLTPEVFRELEEVFGFTPGAPGM